MTVEEKIKGRKIGVIGMARSGMAAAMLARRFGGDVFVSDAAPGGQLTGATNRLAEAGIPFETDRHSDHLLGRDYVVVSPGVPMETEIIARLRDRGIPIFSELEFAFWACRGPVIAVTGSNGKSTTTTLIGKIFEAAGCETFVCGNIGFPFAEIADRVGEDSMAVVEVSTFQLETIADFRPKAALILNLSPDHLDRHGTFDAYRRLKYRIAENQGEDDYLIVNGDDTQIQPSEVDTGATVVKFSIGPPNSAASFVEKGELCTAVSNRVARIIPVDDIAIPGRHNLQNAAAAAVVAGLFGVSPEIVASTLRTFPGVEHRLELVDRVAGISFINDSKATNVASTVVALHAMKEPVHLILGGRDKGGSYEPLITAGRGIIKTIVVIGEAADKIFAALGKSFPIRPAGSLEAAVGLCFEAAHPGEAVLLSPSCASFDMFENFEHRGRVFKEAVAGLKKGKAKNGTLTNH
jgi:UDP-N-acetylmuramoylalanine--D-glutamate ligase